MERSKFSPVRIFETFKRYRKRYGVIHAFRLWVRLHRHMGLERGALHKVKVPGVKHPVVLRAKTSDIQAFLQIFVDGELEFNVPTTQSTIVDAGANIGLASIYFATRFPNAKIVALEIEDSNFEMLKRNTAFYPNITCLKRALWSGPALVTITNSDAESWAFTIDVSRMEDTPTILAVGVKDLVQQFENHYIDLLKIDIEGAEKEVFQHGADDWINQVRTIAVELHDSIKPGCTKSLTDCLKAISHSKYRSGEYTIVDLDIAMLARALIVEPKVFAEEH